MATKSNARPAPGRDQAKRSQERADRTRSLVIDETIRCIREEGFAAASTRHIIERAGVSWGVIQYHFGDRDGLLNAVIDNSFVTLTDSLNELADAAANVTDIHTRAEALTDAAWKLFFNPTCMTAMEILIATRVMRGTLDPVQLAGLQAALMRISALLGDSTPHAGAIANLLWAGPVGMMVSQMVITAELPTDAEQHALADLITDHLKSASRRRQVSRDRRPAARTTRRRASP
jgi:AcrR family transcriptional regulator